ncbi:LTA synthase family protein [Atopobium fossor]|uniref:LTA synthase family protein n=1 Tax=Atopobium fossor TaxID=39487 RepID=UPI000420FD33|nr:alkaline phosphatase family protein [Atopobium fossor]
MNFIQMLFAGTLPFIPMAFILLLFIFTAVIKLLTNAEKPLPLPLHILDSNAYSFIFGCAGLSVFFGLGWSSILMTILSATVLFGFAFIASKRKTYSAQIATALHTLPYRAQIALVDVIAVALLLFSAFYALEAPYNPGFVAVEIPFLFMDLGLMLLAILSVYFISHRNAIANIVLQGFFFFWGIAQYYLWQFKNTAIMPADLFALGTAAAVSANYSYAWKDTALVGVMAFCFGLLVIAYLGSIRAELKNQAQITVTRQLTLKSIGTTMLIGLVSAGLLASALIFPNYTQMGAAINYFWPLYVFRQHGAVLTFTAGVQDLIIKKPAGYNDENAQKLLDKYVAQYDTTLDNTEGRQAAVAQYNSIKPNILVIMDETFADLSVFDNMHDNYTGPEFFNRGLTDSLAEGKLAVSVLGGGTANSEFEFLTGNSMAYIGLGKYPYSIYSFPNFESLPAFLKKQGYGTSSMHPNLASNWNREKTYADMQFDRFYSIDDFPDAPVFHNGVTDKATFDKCLDIIKAADNPQFVFNVTMQNHSDYTKNNIPADRLTSVHPSDLSSPEQDGILNEYLSCIKASDEDLEDLINQLKELKEPTILVYFGDHQPNFTPTYNDAWFSEESDLIHTQRLYHTSYIMWANYDVAGASQTTQNSYSSPNYLAAQTLYAIGAPLTDYQKAQLAIRTQVPAINAFGLLDDKNSWHSLTQTDDSMHATSEEFRTITYFEFATKIK